LTLAAQAGLLAAVTLAFTCEAAAGFGATIITLTLAAHLMPVEAILASFVPVSAALSALLVWRGREAVDLGVLSRHVARVMLPGTLAGMALSGLGDERTLRATFAAFVVVLASIELWRLRPGARRAPTALPAPARIAALFGAGVAHGLFASGGPLLVYVVGRELPDKARFRATLSAVWLGLNALLVARGLASGAMNGETLRESALLLAPLAVGLAIGQRVHDRLDPVTFRVGVFALLLFAGLALLARSV
jgi:uncharacterized membrane protein YfcA